MMNTLNIDFQKTALVIIDLQKGIVPIDQSGQVVPNAKKLVDEFRKHNGFISFVNVAFHDGADALKPQTDELRREVQGKCRRTGPILFRKSVCRMAIIL